MLTEKLTRGDSIALTKGLLIAAWRFCHNELALSVSHSLASSPKGRALSPSLKPLRRYHDRPEQRGDIRHQHRDPHLPAGGTLNENCPRRAGRHQHQRHHRPDPERPQDVLPVSVVVIDARDVDVERTLCKVADAVLVVVAGQSLGHPEHGIRPVDDAENHTDDEQSQRSLDVGQSRRPDGQRFCDAQHAADDIHRQILLRPRLTALRRLCRKGQRLADEVFGLLAGEALFLLYPASLQKLGHRHVQLLGQRHQQRDVRHTQSRFP